MKLLFDQNLSHRLVEELHKLYPASDHVRAVGLQTAGDAEVWEFAKSQDFVIVTKDADFHERAILLGHPPKVIWVRRGNCSTVAIADILKSNHATLEAFGRDKSMAVLMLY